MTKKATNMLKATKLGATITALVLSVLVLAATASAVNAATYTVNTTQEQPNANCTSDNDCSLHGAIRAANADSKPDTIILPAGEYTVYEWLPRITSPMTIKGQGADTTVVRSALGAGDSNHVFYISFEGSNADLVELQHMTISGGSADRGGAIINTGAHTVELYNMELVDNTATEYGGGIFSVDSELNVYNSTLVNNSAAHGGAIYLDKGTSMELVNSTLSKNTADRGGAIYTGPTNDDATGWTAAALSVTYTTIAGNTATEGGGIYTSDRIDREGDSNYTIINNSILAHNTAGTGANYGGILHDINYSVSNDMSGVEITVTENDGNKLNVNAQLNELAKNGAATRTMKVTTASAAVDMIPESVCAHFTLNSMEDQRGIERPQGGACDAGSYEFEQASTGGSNDDSTNEDNENNSGNTGTDGSTDDNSNVDVIGGIAGASITKVKPMKGGIVVHYDNGVKLRHKIVNGNTKPKLAVYKKRKVVVAVFRGKNIHMVDYTNGKKLAFRQMGTKGYKRKNFAVKKKKMNGKTHTVVTAKRKGNTRVATVRVKPKQRSLGKQGVYVLKDVKAQVKKTQVRKKRITVRTKSGKTYTLKLGKKYLLKQI